MAEQRITYVTADGKSFKDADRASEHESYLKNKDVIEAYIAKAGLAKVAAGHARRNIASFLAYQQG